VSDRLDEVLDLLRSIDAKLGSTAQSASSVEVKTSTRGVDTAVKSYAGSPVREAGDAAIEEFMRVTQELTNRLMGQSG
jgi:hypothetical protein